MKIEASVDKTLDNGAVFQHLLELQSKLYPRDDHARSKKRKDDKPKDDHEAVLSKVNDYFANAIAAGQLPDYANFPEQHMEDIVKRLKKFDLVKSEVLMLLNLKPRDVVFMDCIIEELDNRHPDSEDQGEILEIVHSSLGGPEAEQNGDDAMQVDSNGDGGA